MKNIALSFPSSLIALAVAGCGGGGGGEERQEEPPAQSSRIAVEVIAGPLVESAALETASRAWCADGTGSAVILWRPVLALGVDRNYLYTGEDGCDAPRVRRIDLASREVTTVAIGNSGPKYSGNTPLPLENFVSVNAVAQASDGSLLIADTEVQTAGITFPGWRSNAGVGNGIWRLYPDGRLIKLAGFEQPARAALADGHGAQAVFGNISRICTAESDYFYVNDGGVIRQVTLDGRVETLKEADGSKSLGLVCGEDHRSLARTFDPAAKPVQPYELPSKRVFGVLPSNLGPLRALTSGTLAWAYSTNSERTFLLDLSDGREIDGSSIAISEYSQTANVPHSVGLGAVVPVAGGVAYMATRFSVVKVTYK